MEESHFSWFHYVPVLSQFEHHIAGAIVVSLILAVFAVAARLALARNPSYLIPPGRLSFLNFADILSESLYKMTESVLGHDAPTYFPIVGGLFLYILVSNLIGLFPGIEPPSANINTNLACGIFVFFYYNYQGLKHGGLHYLKHFCGPVWYLAWLLLPVEIISHVARPFTLALRLRGNMVGDHTVLSTFTGLAPGGLILPIPFYFLGLMVCVIQAYIFVMLTMVYVSLAKESDH
jgi:F-type H+-transporting ATPase subunit a